MVSPSADGYNAWKRRTVETRPDGATYTVYSNYVGATLLSDLEDSGGNHWYTYNQYNADGRLTLSAESSAVASYADGEGTDWLLDVTFNAGGLVHETTYYSTTTATDTTAGGVAGYVEYTKLRHGMSDANPTFVSKTEYFVRTAGDTTVYPTARVPGTSTLLISGWGRSPGFRAFERGT